MLSRFKVQSGFTLVKAAFIAVALLVIGGGVFLWQSGGTDPNPFPPSWFQFSEHKLVVASQHGLRQFEYSPSDQSYKKQMTATFPELTDIDTVVKAGDNFFLGSERKVVKLNSEFEKVASKEFEKGVGALATDGESILVSAEKSIIAFDKNLDELSRAELEYEGRKKNAHDILVHDDTAFLLDNIMRPVFLFRADITDLYNIQISERIDFQGIGPRLDGQWLNSELKQWLVVHSSGGAGYSRQTVKAYPMQGGDESIFSQTTFSYSRIEEQPPEGVRIEGTTDFAPAWVIVRDMKEGTEQEYHLARVGRKDSKLSLSKVLKVFSAEEISSEGEMIIKKQGSQQGNYLFVASEYGLIKAIAPEPQPEVILSTDVGEVTDILTY